MTSFSNCYMAFNLIIITVGFVEAILNDGALINNRGSIPIYQQEQVHQIGHDKVLRTEDTGIVASHKRQVLLPFSSTASPPGACECMGYWECISNNGQVYTNCGINDSEVCCFYKHKIKGSVNNEKNNNININNNSAKSSAELVPTITTSVVPPTTPAQFYTTGNEFDVDYFYSLEDDVGDLKQITTTENSAEVITTATLNPNLGRPSCGSQVVEWKLDSKAEFSEWPWHVALLEIHQDVYICGGTLISNDRVITAAHCVYPYIRRRNPSELKVRAGEYDISSNDEKYPFVEVSIERIFIHPDFNNATLVNDIAIVKLLHPLNYTNNIMPVCLPEDPITSHFPPYCVITGWGRESETSPFSIVMKEVVVPMWRHEDCEAKLQRNFGTSYKLAPTAICAGELGHDACDGDGGGGLVCYDKRIRRFYLKGVTSFGIGCGRVDTPGVYTNVMSYIKWIESFPYFL